MKITLSFLALLTLVITSNAQSITKGVILPINESTFGSCCVYVPASGINIYNKPNDSIVGKILQDSVRDGNGDFYKIYLDLGNGLELMDHPNWEMNGNEVMALSYIDHKPNFVKTHNGYWINISELEKKGLRIVNTMQYLIEKSQEILGYYANGSGLNLRKSPSTKSEVIMTLKGDLLEIKLTEEINGLWCKVIVTKYSDHPCTSKGNFDEIKIRTYTGWIKLLSDDQTPNVTYYKGC